MSGLLERLNENIKKIALEVVTLEHGDVHTMGKIMKCLRCLEEDSHSLDDPTFKDLTRSLKSYLERLILEETEDISPFEEGIDRLQYIYRSLDNKQIFEEWFPSTGYEHAPAPELEVYLPGDVDSKDYRCQVWIPIVKEKK